MAPGRKYWRIQNKVNLKDLNGGYIVTRDWAFIGAFQDRDSTGRGAWGGGGVKIDSLVKEGLLQCNYDESGF